MAFQLSQLNELLLAQLERFEGRRRPVPRRLEDSRSLAPFCIPHPDPKLPPAAVVKGQALLYSEE